MRSRSSIAAAGERTRNLMMMMSKLSPHIASQNAGAESRAPSAKDGMIDGIPAAPGQPSSDFPEYIPPAVTQVFRNFDPNAEDGGPGYHEADLRNKFLDVMPGAEGLNGRPMTSGSERTLSHWDPNEAYEDDPLNRVNSSRAVLLDRGHVILEELIERREPPGPPVPEPS